MPRELYNQVKDEIPAYIGVYIDGTVLEKRAKKQELKIDAQILKNSLIRSLYRDVDKQVKSNEPLLIEYLNREISRYKNDASNYHRKYNELTRKIYDKYGRDGWKELI
jgi:hypothetical protein